MGTKSPQNSNSFFKKNACIFWVMEKWVILGPQLIMSKWFQTILPTSLTEFLLKSSQPWDSAGKSQLRKKIWHPRIFPNFPTTKRNSSLVSFLAFVLLFLLFFFLLLVFLLLSFFLFLLLLGLFHCLSQSPQETKKLKRWREVSENPRSSVASASSLPVCLPRSLYMIIQLKSQGKTHESKRQSSNERLTKQQIGTLMTVCSCVQGVNAS